MIQRLYGDENGLYHDVGRPHPTSIHGFLRIVQRAHSPKIHILSEVLSQSIMLSSLSPVLSKYLRSCSAELEWIFIPLHDRTDQRDPVWSLIGIDLATRRVGYHWLHSASGTGIDQHTNSISTFLQRLDHQLHNTDPPWNHESPTFADFTYTDSGIWICLLVQVLVHRLPTSIITFASIHEARPYITMGLLEQTLPSFASMLIRRMGAALVSPVTPDHDTLSTVANYHPIL
jgi:hypothetical protein